MRWLLSLIFVMVTLSSAFATETKTEYITEEVCHAVAGCWVNVKTGECPDCVTETRKVVTVKSKRSFRDFSVKKKPSNFVWEKEDDVMIASVPIKKSKGSCIGNCDYLNKMLNK